MDPDLRHRSRPAPQMVAARATEAIVMREKTLLVRGRFPAMWSLDAFGADLNVCASCNFANVPTLPKCDMCDSPLLHTKRPAPPPLPPPVPSMKLRKLVESIQLGLTTLAQILEENGASQPRPPAKRAAAASAPPEPRAADKQPRPTAASFSSSTTAAAVTAASSVVGKRAAHDESTTPHTSHDPLTRRKRSASHPAAASSAPAAAVPSSAPPTVVPLKGASSSIAAQRKPDRREVVGESGVRVGDQVSFALSKDDGLARAVYNDGPPSTLRWFVEDRRGRIVEYFLVYGASPDDWSTLATSATMRDAEDALACLKRRHKLAGTLVTLNPMNARRLSTESGKCL
jgi:hypothetical protein